MNRDAQYAWLLMNSPPRAVVATGMTTAVVAANFDILGEEQHDYCDRVDLIPVGTGN